MTMSDDLTDRLGSVRLVELTNFDDATATTVNSTRLTAAITDATGAIRRRGGLDAPTDTTTDEYDTFRELVMLGVVYYLEWYRNRHGQETTSAGAAFNEALNDLRQHSVMPTLTDSVVDNSNQDQVSRPARFAPNHFTGFRIGTDSATDLDYD